MSSLYLEQRPALAVAEFQKALQAEPNNIQAQANLAAALFALHRYSEASAAFALAV